MNDNESTMAIANDPDCNEWLHQFVGDKKNASTGVSHAESTPDTH